MKVFLIILSNLLILLVIALIGFSFGEKIYSYIYSGEEIIIDYNEFLFPAMLFLVAFFSQIKVAYWKSKITSILFFSFSTITFIYNIYKVYSGGVSWWISIGYTLGIKEDYLMISGILLLAMLFCMVIGSFVMVIN